MGKRLRYEPGTFCWVDLATTDLEGARAFYSDLFGWEAEDTPGEAGGTYTMLRLTGDEVCAFYEMDEARREQGVPPHWSSYVSVEDVEAVAERARDLGGAVRGEPFDSYAGARMAVIEDPAGAALAAWQPGTWAGAARVNDVGCMGWNELQARDPDVAAAFYGGLFGWDTEPIKEGGKTVYVTIRNAGWINGGIMPMDERHGDAPSYWLPYFTVESCDGVAEQARQLGGQVLAGPMDPGAGRIAVVADPQGAVFSVFEGETDD